MIGASRLSSIVFVLVASCGLAPSAIADEARAVQTTRPARGEVVRFVTLPGRIQANRKATLYAKVSGYLATLTVEEDGAFWRIESIQSDEGLNAYTGFLP